MQVRQLECFIAVAEELHFRRAAERLYLANAAVSQQIRALEKELGTCLFERTTRRVRLTPSGALLLDRARTILSDLENLRSLPASVAAPPPGQLRCYYHPSVGPLMARLTRAFTAVHPEVDVVPESISPFDIAAWIGQNENAVALHAQPAPMGEPELPRGYAMAVLARSPLGCLAVPSNHRLAGWSAVSVHDLHGERMLRADAGPFDAHARFVADFFTRHGVQPQWRPVPIRNELDQARAVAAGLGVMLMRSRFVEAVEPGVSFIPLVEQGPEYIDRLIWVGTSRTSRAAVFADFALRLDPYVDPSDVGGLAAREVLAAPS